MRLSTRSVMIPVVCKFKFSGIKRTDQGNGKVLSSLEFYPVYDRPENKKFWEATPSGSLVLGVVNEDAVIELDLGKEYYITISDKPFGVLVK